MQCGVSITTSGSGQCEGAEPYLLDLYAAICHDAGDMPSVEGARQFWEQPG